MIPRVLVFLRHDEDVLLLKGAPTKRIWANLYNGVGGHVEPGEDILSAARREVLEETGFAPPDLELKAIATIDAGDPHLGILMFCFQGWVAGRQFAAGEEGDLHWIPVAALASHTLVEDLAWLLPRLLTMPDDAEPLYLHYYYDAADRLVIRPAGTTLE